MRKLRNISKFLSLLICWLCFGVSVWAQQGLVNTNSTDGNDFWLAFVSNNSASNQESSLECVIYCTLSEPAKQEITIYVQFGTTQRTITIPVGQTIGKFEANATDRANMYSYVNKVGGEQEQVIHKGIRVYTKQHGVAFSCFGYCKVGEGENTTQDAFLVLPASSLGKEYYVQTYWTSILSNEFVVVATEDSTKIEITLPSGVSTFNGAAGTISKMLLKRGDSYLVPSLSLGDAGKARIDLSGTTICATKPIAVFTANEAVKAPVNGAYSADFMMEQVPSLHNFGTQFYLGKAAHTIQNRYNILAVYPNTVVNISRTGPGIQANDTYTLNAGQTLYEVAGEGVLQLSSKYSHLTVTTSLPTLCFSYLTCGAANQELVDDPVQGEISLNWGNPSTAMVPTWDQRVKKISFITQKLKPEEQFAAYQIHYVQVVAKTADAATFTLDGNAVSSSEFKPFPSDPTMAVANVEVRTEGRHLLSTTGDGFIGYVYGMSNAQAYQYTLGFNPQNNKDSLFITNEDSVMSQRSYEMERTSSGWYLRQLHDWFDIDSARLDTAWTCDSTWINFHLRSRDNVFNDTVKWKVYHLKMVTDSLARRDKLMYDTLIIPSDNLIPDWNHLFTSDHTQDSLPPGERDPFDLYEVEMMIYRGHLVCHELMHDVDTLHTIVHINRSYNDTILRRLVCITDTVQCFWDDPTHTIARAPASLAKTTFMSEGNPQWKEDPYVDTLKLGENYYSRQYQTIYGCDSIATFLLYVCDTVRIRVDTTICQNQVLSFEGKSEYFQGVKFDHEGTYLDTLKTHDCDGMKAFYDTINLFHGCDSILELTLHICDTFNIYARDTFCSNDTWTYEWRRDGRVEKDSLVRTLKINPDSVNKWLEFRDTTHTVSCPKCHDGGCDSIFILQLYVAASSHVTETDQYCGQYYDPATGKLKDRTYEWKTCTSDSVWDSNNGRRILKDSIQRMALGTTNTFIDSLLSVNGCDSITNLVLTRDKAFLKVEYWRMGDNETYTWKGHGPNDGDIVLGPFEERETPYIFHDSALCVTGCDSIYRLEIMIAQSFEQTVYARICDDSTFVWTNHTSADKYAPTTAGPRVLYDATRKQYITSDQIYGRKVGADGYSQGTYTIVDSMKMDRSVDGHTIKTDSVWVLQLTVDSTYDHHRYDTICDDGSIVFNGTTYYGKDYKRPHPQLGTFEVTNTMQAHNACLCDSTVTMHLTVAPRFYQFDSIHLCDDCSQNWPNRKDSHGDSVLVHFDKAGTYTLWDSTTTYLGCDSVYELRVFVTPSYDILDLHHEMCDNEEFTWTGHKAKDLVSDTLIKGWAAGTYTLWDSLKTIPYGCDSVYKLTLTIHPTYKFDDERVMCDKDTLTWQGRLFVGNKFSGTPAATPYRTVSTGSYVDTAFYAVESQFGCDSTYCLALRVYQSFYQKEDSTICQDDPFTWKNHEGHTLVDATGKTIDITSVPLRPGEYTLIDHLYNTECTSCTSGNGCDSIYELHVKVNPSYKNARVVKQPITICQLDAPYVWEGHEDASTHSGYKEFSVSGSYWDTLPTIGCACDSVVNLILTVVDNTPRRIDTTVCQNESAFTIGANKYKVSPKDSLPGLHTIVSSIPVGTCCTYQETINIRINPVYNNVVYDTVCQHIDGTYTWKLHPDIAPISISKAGKQTIVDAQKTRNGCDCDSVWTLYLNVLPSYYRHDTVTISSEQTTQWQDTIYGGVRATRPDGATYYVTVLKDTTIHTPLTTKPIGTHFCDSILDHTIRVGKVFRDTTYDYTCAGSEYVWNITSPIDGKVTTKTISNIPTAGTHGYYYHKCTTAMGYDSIYTLDLYTAPTYQLEEIDTICQTSPYTWEKHESRILYLNGTPISSDAIPTTDSAKWLTIVDSLTTQSMIRTRQAGSTTWETKTFGCDSVWTLKLYVAPVYTADLNRVDVYDEIMDGETYHWNKQDYTKAGVYSYKTETKTFGCDSIIFLNLCVKYDLHFYDTICTGESVEFEKKQYTATGDYLYTDKTKAYSCDSIRTLHLLVLPKYSFTESHQMSDEEYYKWQGTTYLGTRCSYIPAPEEKTVLVTQPSNTYYASYQTELIGTHSCDSIYTLHLSIGEVFRDTTYDYTCAGSEYIWNITSPIDGKVTTKTITDIPNVGTHGYYYHTCTTAMGYDSIYTLDLYTAPTYQLTHKDTVCQTDTYIWQKHEGRTLYLNGTPISSDAIPTADFAKWVTVIDSLTTQGTIRTRQAGSNVWETKTFGCDSIWTLNLYVAPVYTGDLNKITDYLTLSNTDTISWEGSLYKGADFKQPIDASKYTHVFTVTKDTADSRSYTTKIGELKPSLACDSMRFLDLKMNYFYTMTDTVCQDSAYSWQPIDMAAGHVYLNGKVVSSISTHEVGLWKYIDSLHTVSELDSIYELNLLIPHSYAIYDTIMMSNEEDTVWEGRHYAGELSKHRDEPGYTTVYAGDNHDTVFHHAFYDATHYCDSIRYLTIRIGKVFRDTTFDTSCGNETYVWYGKDAQGKTITRKTIQPATWGEKSIYEDKIIYKTSQGYDSIYYLKLTLHPYYLVTPERTTVDSICQGSEYIWSGHEGRSLFFVNKAKTITDLKSLAATLPVGSYTFHDSIGSSLGCDSVWALTLRVDSVYDILTTYTICDNDTLEWEHRLYVGKNFQEPYDASKYSAVIIDLEPQAEFTDDSLYHTVHGCDSLRRLSLRINPTYLNVAAKDTVYAHICDNESYTFLDKTFNEHGEWVVSSHALTDNKVGRQVLVDTIKTDLGCDSAVSHVVYVHPTYLDITRVTIGDNVVYEWRGQYFDGKSLDKSVTHIAWDSIQGGTQTYSCDSVYKLELNVARSFQYYDTIHLCTGGTDNSYRWQHLPDIDTTFSNLHKGTYDYSDTLKTKQFACDSIFSVHIVVDTAYLVPVETTYAHICQNETYHFYDSVCNAKGEWVPATMGETNTFTLTYNDQTITGCDSAVCHMVTVHPTYVYQTYDTVCQRLPYSWNPQDFADSHVYLNGKIVTSIVTDVVGDYVYYDSLATTTWGCDSVQILYLNIPHSYRFDSLHTMSDEDSLHWQGHIFVGETFRGDTTGQHVEVLTDSYSYFEEHYPAYYSNRYCDSAYYLTIRIGKVFRDTLYDFTCANEPYSWMTNNASGYHPTHSGMDSLIRTVSPVVAIDTIVKDVYKTALGFDSIYYLNLHRTPVYDSVFTDTICQGALYLWPRHSTTRTLYVDGDYSKPISESEIPTFDSAQWVTVVDYLSTTTEFPRRHKNETTMVETSCDSTWTLHLYVAPTYDGTYNTIVDPYIICDNDTLSWERRLYVGHKWQEYYPTSLIDSARYDTVITVTKDTIDHFDTITTLGLLSGYDCDSIRFLQLTVHHIDYDTTGTRIICNNDNFSFGEAAHHFEWDKHYQFSTEFTIAPDTFFSLADTVPNRFGCDSVTKIYVTVHPSYRFDTIIEICSGQTTIWRKYNGIGMKYVNFLPTGTYYDSLTTQFGCDSIYVLHLIVHPSRRTVYTDHMCIGDTLWFDGKAYPFDPNYDNMQTDHMVYYISSYSTEDGCDSTLICYPYWHPKFLFVDSALVCGGDPYVWHNSRGDTVLWPLPGDGQEVYYDSLHTHFSYVDAFTGEWTQGDGCDSVYKFILKHHAVYRDLADYDTICPHTTFDWNMHTTHRLYCKNDGKYYSGTLAPPYSGNWQFVDSLKTIYGCDSIWTLNLYVRPDYHFREDTTFCTERDVEFDWHGRHIHIIVDHSKIWYDGQHFDFSDTFKTIYGCDSIYDMYVHVYAVQRVEEHQTMCTGDFYDFHGKPLTHGGVYVDTLTVESTGCRLITTLYLKEVAPTRAKIDVNYLCINDGQINLKFAFDSTRYPNGYSIVYSDEFLKACADRHLTPTVYDHEPYTAPDEITLSLPSILEPTQYIRPDDYIASVVFHGVCINDSLTTEQFSYQLRYPSWLTEQHWNDAIAVLVDSLNGGYHFTRFQWYKDNQQMIGETHPYLYCPQYLEANTEYSVALTRSSDGKTFLTCPIVPDLSRQQTLTPTQPYISVVPTLVVRENPVVNILCVNPGTFEVFDPYGRMIQSGQFTPGPHNAYEIRLTPVPGVYVFRLSESSGLKRTVKVLVE